jgi:hypothetical protein
LHPFVFVHLHALLWFSRYIRVDELMDWVTL